jgi:hypothetical protein
MQEVFDRRASPFSLLQHKSLILNKLCIKRYLENESCHDPDYGKWLVPSGSHNGLVIRVKKLAITMAKNDFPLLSPG